MDDLEIEGTIFKRPTDDSGVQMYIKNISPRCVGYIAADNIARLVRWLSTIEQDNRMIDVQLRLNL